MRAKRYIVATAVLLVSAAVAVFQSGGAQPVTALEETLVPPDGREQLPLIYVHGFNDDGSSWGDRGGPYWNALRDITPGAGDPNTTPVENYAVQFSAPGGNPFANSDLGWAVLQTPAEMALPSPETADYTDDSDSNPYNSPDPVSFFIENFIERITVPDIVLPPLSSGLTKVPYPIARLIDQRIRSNYNRNGRAEYHAEDLKDLLRAEFGGGIFDDDLQLNMITHSAGGLDTRALLALLNQSDSRAEQERVANVMFTAPPFGGSTIAEIANLFYDDLDASFLLDPWFAAVIENQVEPPFNVWLRSQIIATSFDTPTAQEIDDVIEIIAEAADLLGFNLRLPPALLSTLPGAPQALVGGIELVSPLISDLFGFPGTPKVNVDLRPSGAVSNLQQWERNPYAMQFVTWGEGGIGYNLSPDISQVADNNYRTLDDITNPGYLTAKPGDLALTSVSARTLTTDAPGGWMVPLQGYPNLTHSDLIVDTPTTGKTWVEALMAPVTTLRLVGPLEVADLSERYYVVSPEFIFDFLPELRTFRDQFGNEITVRPPTGANTGGVQYRVVSYPGGEGPVFGEWQDLDVTQSAARYETGDVSFSDLETEYGLAGETLFLLQWRSVNELGGREGIRGAWFRIDGEPPTVTSIQVVDTADESDTSEIFRRSPTRSRFKAVRGALSLSKQSTILYQQKIQNRIETQWVVRQSNRIKVLKIDFDSRGTIRYVWDNSKKLVTDPQTLVNRDFLGQVLNVLDPGPHTLYYYAEDSAGNRSDTQSVSVLVDSQPPVTALDYQSAHPLGLVVGPNTPLRFEAQDAPRLAASLAS